MNIQTAIQKAEEITGINAQQVLNDLGIAYNSLANVTEIEATPELKSQFKAIAKAFGIDNSLFLWLALEEEDVEVTKLDAYKLLKPVMDSLIEETYKARKDERINDTNRES